jgi:small subunit ribosomal protein S17
MVEPTPTKTERKPRRTMSGVVVSDKMQKTVVVRVEKVRTHRLYGKQVRLSERYKAHDEHNQCRVGDEVVIAESRPLSKDKRWNVVQIVRQGNPVAIEAKKATDEVPS